jgi:hypothetical protein
MFFISFVLTYRRAVIYFVFSFLLQFLAHSVLVVKAMKKYASSEVAAGEPGSQHPTKRRLWARIGRVFFNPDSGAVLLRTPLSWVKILALTLVYWVIVCGSALVCWAIFQVAHLSRAHVSSHASMYSMYSTYLPVLYVNKNIA